MNSESDFVSIVKCFPRSGEQHPADAEIQRMRRAMCKFFSSVDSPQIKIIQKTTRGFLAKKHYLMKREHCIMIQKNVRMWKKKRIYQKLKNKVMMIQRNFRKRDPNYARKYWSCLRRCAFIDALENKKNKKIIKKQLESIAMEKKKHKEILKKKNEHLHDVAMELQTERDRNRRNKEVVKTQLESFLLNDKIDKNNRFRFSDSLFCKFFTNGEIQIKEVIQMKEMSLKMNMNYHYSRSRYKLHLQNNGKLEDKLSFKITYSFGKKNQTFHLGKNETAVVDDCFQYEDRLIHMVKITFLDDSLR